MANDNKNSKKNLTDSKLPMLTGSQGKLDQAKSNEWAKNLKSYDLSGKRALDPKSIMEKSGQNSKISVQSIDINKQNSKAKQNAEKCSNFCKENGFWI